MFKKLIIALLLFAFTLPVNAQYYQQQLPNQPYQVYDLYSNNGTYMGNTGNQYDPNSINNPYGQYGSKYSPNSINHPYSQYGSPYSMNSPNNMYAPPAKAYPKNNNQFYYNYGGNGY